MYDQLKNKPRLVNKKVCLQSANGSELKCDGSISVQVCISSTEMSQEFYVIRELNRNMILETFFLRFICNCIMKSYYDHIAKLAREFLMYERYLLTF